MQALNPIVLNPNALALAAAGGGQFALIPVKLASPHVSTSATSEG